MTTTNIPADGSTIIFDRAPSGSWVREGDAYRVEHIKGRRGLVDIRFESVERGSATYDRPVMVARSAWHVA